MKVLPQTSNAVRDSPISYLSAFGQDKVSESGCNGDNLVNAVVREKLAACKIYYAE